MRLSVPVRQKARMLALIGVLLIITLEKGGMHDLNCDGSFAVPFSYSCKLLLMSAAGIQYL